MSEFRDKGPWQLFEAEDGRVGIISDDFTHDVVLYVNGDFADHDDNLAYAMELIEFMNTALKRNQNE